MKRNPTVVPVRFKEIILPEHYKSFRWQFFRVHFQFVMANEVPHPYDFFMIVCGPIPLTEADEPPTPQGVYHRWSVGRATEGDVVVSWKAPPRRVTAATNNGPLFDLREEAGGFAGSGNGFFAGNRIVPFEVSYPSRSIEK